MLNQNIIEGDIIPALVKESNTLSKLMHLTDKDLPNGVYTPVTNCSWFAGNLWKQMTKLVFEQPITNYVDVDDLAKRMGLPFISKIREIGDPGMLAESIQNGNWSE